MMLRICKKCVLPENFPGIKFDESGICSHCQRFEGIEKQKTRKEIFRKTFFSLLEEVKGKGAYDVLVAYSGGKDSTYLLKMLKESFDLNIFALTFDHGFLSESAVKNIHLVADAMNVDHCIFRPGASTMRDVFKKSIYSNIYPPKAMERTSAICQSCMNIAKLFLLKSAVEMNIPLIAYGWSPGQAPLRSSVFKTNPSIIRHMQKAISNGFKQLGIEGLTSFFLSDRHYDMLNNAPSNIPLYFINPLVFMEYDGATVLRDIREIGWKRPDNTDANSTNCLLNTFATRIHVEQYGFHPYALDIAGLVRMGHMNREEGMARLSAPLNQKIFELVKNRLGIFEKQNGGQEDGIYKSGKKGIRQ